MNEGEESRERTPRETKRLYECRYCGAISGSKVGGCPNCDYNETKEKTVAGLDGETTIKKPWYRSFEVVLRG
jgi:predicted ATP-dependent serine protease